MATTAVDHHNRVLAAGIRRALELEPKLVNILKPILDRAADSAARAFQTKATPLRLPSDGSLTSAAGATRTLQDAADAVDAAGRQLQTALHGGSQEDVEKAQQALTRAKDRLQRELLGEREKQAKKAAKKPQDVVNEAVDGPAPQTPEQRAAQEIASQGGPSPRAVQVSQQVLEKGAEETRVEDEIAGLVEQAQQGKPGDIAKRARELLKPLAGEADWVGPVADEIVNVAFLVDQLLAKTAPVREAVVQNMMQTAVEGAGLVFDVNNPFAAAVLAQSASQITNIAATTQLNVMRIIKESHDAGLSIPDTAKAIRSGMKEANVARATLIARTELAGAVNGGSLAATQIVQSATGETLYKTWLTAPGARYPRHEDYDGLDEQTQTLDAYFDVGGTPLQYPGDPDGPPEEVCNCRCALVYVSADDAAQQGVQLGGTSQAPAPQVTPELALPMEAQPPQPQTVVTSDPTTAAQALWNGQKVTLTQPTEVATLIDDLGQMAKDAQEKGLAAPPLDLGKVTVPGTNLFTQQSIGVPRVEMPQLKGVPTPGSLADAMPRDSRGEVDIAPLFYKHLQDEGIKIERNQTVRVDHLRATQTELDGVKVAGIMDYLEGGGKIEGSIPVTKDGYVIDGHHRWAAEVGLDYKNNANKPWTIQADVVDKDVTSIINEANIFAAEYGIPQQSAFVQQLGQVKAQTSIGITPFRPGDQAVNFYDTEKARQFEADLEPTAREFGVTIDANTRATGVWQGAQEPSYALTAHDGPDGVAKFAATMRAKYDQDGVLLFQPDPSGASFSYTLHRVDPNAVIPKLADHGIQGATAVGDTVTIIGDQALADDVARLADSVKSVVTVKRGTVSLVERGETPRSVEEIHALHPNVELALNERDGGLVVSMIRVPVEQQGKGEAAAAMDDVLRYADQNGLTVALTPEAVTGGLSTTQLRQWYKRLGFVPNKGRDADLRFTEAMVRPAALARPAAAVDPYTKSIQGELKRLNASIAKATASKDASALAGLTKRRGEMMALLKTGDLGTEVEALSTELKALHAKLNEGALTDADRLRIDLLSRRNEQLLKIIDLPGVAIPRPPSLEVTKLTKPAQFKPGDLNRYDTSAVLTNKLAGKPDNAFIELPPHDVPWDVGAVYHAGPSVAWRKDGVIFTKELQINDPSPAAAAERAQHTTDKLFADLPPALKGRVTEINSYRGNNPSDDHWRQVYPGFTGSAAASGDHVINFFMGEAQLSRSTFEHELGHIVGWNGGPPDQDAWVAAAKADQRAQEKLFNIPEDQMIEGRSPGDTHGFLVGTAPISRYGSNSFQEDWAETMRLYLLDQRTGSVGTVEGKSYRFADLWPNRAAIFAKALKVPTTLGTG